MNRYEEMSRGALIREAKESADTIAQMAEALAPFAALGSPFVKQGESDDSPWTEIADDVWLQVGALEARGWSMKVSVKVGDLRRAWRQANG